MKVKSLKNLIGLVIVGCSLLTNVCTVYANNDSNIITVRAKSGKEIKGIEIEEGHIRYDNTTIEELTGEEALFSYTANTENQNGIAPYWLYFDTWRASIGGSNNNTVYLERNGSSVDAYNIYYWNLPAKSGEANLVRILQIALMARVGVGGSNINGVYSSETISALASFRHLYMSKPATDTNPVCDSATWRKLFYVD